MRLLALVTAMLFSVSAIAGDSTPHGFNAASVPEQLRVLEGRIAFIKIPPQEEAPLTAAEGAVLMGNAPAQIVTPENTMSVPVELALRDQQFDRFVQGYISEDNLTAFIEKQSSTTAFAMLKDGTAVRLIAPRVDDGFATQVLPLTGEWSKDKLGSEVHLWVNSCFLRFESSGDQELFNRGKSCR
jgi:hypothetical protein